MKRKRKDASRLVRKHLPEVSRALLEGENKEKFAAFLKEHERQGLYALYKKNGELYYVGRASDLLQRLSAHRSDLHGKKWDKLAIYIINEKLKLHDVESLLIGGIETRRQQESWKTKERFTKGTEELHEGGGIGRDQR
ncbi:MAG: GIY-YIG nuclease family protein [Candidatus Acidiferrales bacterium]